MKNDPLTDLRARYVYTRETRDKWTLLNAPDGPLQGDCEDWAYTMLWICAGGSWLTFWKMLLLQDAELWWTKFHGNGEPHVMLWVRGKGWTDSYYKDWSIVEKHPKLKRYSALSLPLVLLLK